MKRQKNFENQNFFGYTHFVLRQSGIARYTTLASGACLREKLSLKNLSNLKIF